MSTPNPFEAVFQQFLGILKADVLSAFGTPLVTFLQADAAAGGDLAKIMAALNALQVSALAAIPTNLPTYVTQVGQLNTAVANLALQKLQGWLASQKPAS